MSLAVINVSFLRIQASRIFHLRKKPYHFTMSYEALHMISVIPLILIVISTPLCSTILVLMEYSYTSNLCTGSSIVYTP